jgi:hypothetical protein
MHVQQAQTAEQVGMKLYRTVVRRTATQAPEFIDITDAVLGAVEDSAVQEGTVTIFSRHTTAAVVINENCAAGGELPSQRLRDSNGEHDRG